MRNTGMRIFAVMFAMMFLLGCASAAFAEGDWTCPNCGRVNSADANFCGGCRSSKPQAVYNVETLANARECPSCGKIGPMSDNFCTNCGGDYASSRPDAYLAEKPVWNSVAFASEGSEALSGTMRDKGQMDRYTFVPAVDGVYGLVLSEAKSGFKLKIGISDSQGKMINTWFGVSGGDCINAELEAGVMYSIDIYQYDETGSYTVSLCKASPVRSIDGVTFISDSMFFEDQQNRYVFTAPVTGVWRIFVKECNKGFKTDLTITDTQGYTIKSGWGYERDEGLTATLTAGQRYYLTAEQQSSLDSYVLGVMCPRKVLDISGCKAVGDEITYKDEELRYAYTAPVSGEYRFTMRFMKAGVKCDIEITDADGYTVKSGWGYGAGDSMKVSLEAGRTYTVVLSQQSGLGACTMGISHGE